MNAKDLKATKHILALEKTDSQSVNHDDEMTGSPRSAGKPPQLTDPDLYVNRELSLLAFQRRVLEEAQEKTTLFLNGLSSFRSSDPTSMSFL